MSCTVQIVGSTEGMLTTSGRVSEVVRCGHYCRFENGLARLLREEDVLQDGDLIAAQDAWPGQRDLTRFLVIGWSIKP